MLPRTPEPEVMDSAAEAAEYDAMDHGEVNRAFVADLVAAYESGIRSAESGRPLRAAMCLDVATGTALIPIELHRAQPGIEIVACDRSDAMLQHIGRRAPEQPTRISSIVCDARQLPFGDDSFDVTMSNSLLHHLPGSDEDDYAVMRTCLSEMRRVTRSGGLLFLRDLLRPGSAEEVETLVETYCGSETPFARQLFRQSLHASLTTSELKDVLDAVGLPSSTLRQTSDRHWTLASRV